MKRVKDSFYRDNLKKEAFEGKVEISEMFNTDKDLLLMRSTFTSEFYKIYNDGFDNYLNGNWEIAKQNFENVLNIRPDDKVTKNLMSFMEENDYTPPVDW